jgi:hypothetical protein
MRILSSFSLPLWKLSASIEPNLPAQRKFHPPRFLQTHENKTGLLRALFRASWRLVFPGFAQAIPHPQVALSTG